MSVADQQPHGARDVRYLVVRYDDYAPQTPCVRRTSGVEVETELFELFHHLAVKAVVGVIPFPADGSTAPQPDSAQPPTVASWLGQPQDAWVVLLRDYVARGTVEPALHGFQHRRRTPPGFRPGEFRGQTYEWQREAIRRGRDVLAAAIDVSPKIFVPPWNGWDANTARALSELGFGWCSADLHHAESPTNSVRYAPQCTADPKGLLAVLHTRDVPAGSIVVLVTHPLDFEGPNGRAYFQALEELLTFVSSSPQWRCVGLTDLPEAPIEQWNERLRRAVTWDRTQQFLQDSWGPPVLLRAQPVVYRPLSWYCRHTWPWQLALAATIMLSTASGGLVAWILARCVFTSRRLVWVAALLAGAALTILILGTISISRHDYLIRGVRWQAISVAAGMTLGFWTGSSGNRRAK